MLLLRIVSLCGGEAEGGQWVPTFPHVPLMAGGEREGGHWYYPPPTAYLSGGEAEGGELLAFSPDVVPTSGGEAEGGQWVPTGPDVVPTSGGEAEGGQWVPTGPDVVPTSGGEAEGGTLTALWLADLSGGEAEGGEMFPMAPIVIGTAGGEAEGGEMTGGVVAPTPTYTGCSLCALTFNQWQLIAAGFTGDFAGLNGTWILTKTTGCNWTTGGVSPVWVFSPPLIGGGMNLLGTSSPGSITYHEAAIVCTSDNTLAYSSSLGTGSHPGTLTLTPYS